MERFNIIPHADGYVVRDGGDLIRDTKGEALVYASREMATYCAEAIHRAVYPTLRRAV